MSTLDSLLVRIDASTELLRRELQKGGVAVDQFARNTDRKVGGLGATFGNVQKHLRGMLAAFGVGLGATAVVNFAKGAIQAADAIGETARAAGMAAERFQRLSFVFQNNGVDAAQFEAAMKTLNTRLGQFVTTGGGPAKVALDRLGLSQRVLNGEIRTSDDLFRAIVKAFENVASSAERNALAVALFGRQAGPLMADQLSKGTAALEEAAAAANNVFTDRQVRNADALNDAIKRLTTSVGVGLKGALIDVASVWARAFGVDEFGGERPEDEVLKELDLRERGIRSGFTGTPEERERQLADIAAQRNAIVNRPRFRTGGTLEGEVAARNAAAQGLRGMNRIDVNNIGDVYSRNPGIGLRRPSAELEQFDGLQEIAVVINKMPAELKKLSPEFNKAVEALGRYNDGLKDAQERQRAIVDTIGNALQSTLANAFRGVSTDWKDLLKDMAAQLLSSGLTKSIMSLFGSGKMGGGSGGPFATFFSGLFGGARANGGPVQSGKGYLVNEGKPELFWPGMSGSMVPVASAGGRGGGVVVHVTNYIQAGLPPQWTAQLAAMGQITSQAVDKATSKRQRGER